ncbi:hypothetical protein C8R46DRAFT_1026003 [Mycena filopes]|nr:hypothetical protein C8R46DRAFT_1026003 [Mycena filopes]
MPPENITTGLGLACHKCERVLDPNNKLFDQNKATSLSACSGCRIIYYCSDVCQKAHWNDHKALCKVLRKIEEDLATTRDLAKAFRVPMPAEVSPAMLNKVSIAAWRSCAKQVWDGIFKHANSHLDDDEGIVLAVEPKCLACARTGLILRVEARLSGGDASKLILKPCPGCKMAFTCSDAHWAAARDLHQAPDPELPDNLSQCRTNMQIRQDIDFRCVMSEKHFPVAMWWFIPRQEAWSALQPRTWEIVVGPGIAASPYGPVLGPTLVLPSVRLVSSLTTTTLTALYALEHLNSTTAWTKKSTLTIHVLGSLPDFHPGPAFTYEAILHLVPNVVFCNPEVGAMGFVPPGTDTVVRDRDVCSSYFPLDRKISHRYVAKHYDDYVRASGASFHPPDLAIAINCYLTANEPDAWRRILELLAARHIPSVFTAYDQKAAERDLAHIRESCGGAPAEFSPGLTMVKNPWASLPMHPSFDRVYGFHSPNGWLTAGFR